METRPTRHGSAWSADDLRELAALSAADCDLNRLAAATGRSRASIRYKLLALAPPVPRQGEVTAPVGCQPPGGPSAAPEPVRQDMPTSASLAGIAIPRHEKAVQAVRAALDALDAASDRATLGAAQSRFLRASRLLEEQLSRVLEQPPQPDENDEEDDLDPQRLRRALIGLVSACVAKDRDRSILVPLLGLEGDGFAPTLAALGERFGVSRERIRQIRERAMRSTFLAAPRRPASVARLRTALRRLDPGPAAGPRWIEPAFALPFVLAAVTDVPMAARLACSVICRAAGWAGTRAELMQRILEIEPGVIEARSAAEPPWLSKWETAAADAFFPGEASDTTGRRPSCSGASGSPARSGRTPTFSCRALSSAATSRASRSWNGASTGCLIVRRRWRGSRNSRLRSRMSTRSAVAATTRMPRCWNIPAD